jgi:hypothetical protein
MKGGFDWAMDALRMQAVEIYLVVQGISIYTSRFKVFTLYLEQRGNSVWRAGE